MEGGAGDTAELPAEQVSRPHAGLGGAGGGGELSPVRERCAGLGAKPFRTTIYRLALQKLDAIQAISQIPRTHAAPARSSSGW